MIRLFSLSGNVSVIWFGLGGFLEEVVGVGRLGVGGEIVCVRLGRFRVYEEVRAVIL